MTNSPLFMVIAMMLAINFNLYSQRTIHGQVTEQNNTPLVGAYILVPNTDRGTTTDLNGAFTLELQPEDDKLEVSYAGYATQLLAITANDNLCESGFKTPKVKLRQLSCQTHEQ